MTRKIHLLGGVMSVACMLAAGQACAQAAPASNQSAEAETTIGEIVVTARRRQESVQDVPTAIVAFDQQTLTRKAVVNSYDVAKVVPGLSVNADSGSPGLPSFSIRGRGQNFGAASGSVETYFADVPLSSPYQMPQLPPQFFDVQSFQVLKGPQGTLFGRNTTGGAVLIVPQAPQESFGGYFRAQLGDFANRQFEGAVNIPIVEDKVLLRLAGFDWQRHGYMHTTGGLPNDLNPNQILPAQDADNQNTKEARISLLVRPTDQLTNTTIFTYHYDKTRNAAGPGLNLFGPGVVAGSVALPTVPGNPTIYASPNAFGRDLETTVDLNRPATKVWATINTTAFDINSNLTIKNIFGFIHARGYTNDAVEDDGTAALTTLDLLQIPRPRVNTQVTDELQLQGNAFDRRLTYTIGGLLDRTYEPGDPNNINPSTLNVSGSPFDPATLAYQTRFVQNNSKSHSIYGAATFKVTNELNFSAGYRYTWDDIYSKQGSSADSPVVISTADASTIPGGLNSFSREFSGPTYNVDLAWHPTVDNMIYGGFRHGYKRGGFNVSVPIASLANFGPEKVNDFFIGSKNNFTIAGVAGRLNIEAFYDKLKNQQVSYLSAFTAPGIAFEIIAPTINVPKTTYYGADVDFVLEPTQWLSVSGAYSYLRANNGAWVDNSIPGSAIDLSQNNVVFVPKNKYSVSFRFHTELPDGLGEVALTPTVSHQDLMYTMPFNSVLPLGEALITGLLTTGAPTPVNIDQTRIHGASSIPAYTLLDLRAEWNHIKGSKVDLAMGATNLTNKSYVIGNSGTLPVGVQSEAPGAPRMVYVEVRTSF